MIAALQMYDWEGVQTRTDRFWDQIAICLDRAGIEAPLRLARPKDISVPWTKPDLVLAQTCGLPFVSGRCGSAVLVGRPVYDVPGTTDGGLYSSALIARRDEPAELNAYRGKRAAINDLGSQSGCNALADRVLQERLGNGEPFFGAIIKSGGHRFSARMVAQGKADIAAIDAVSWALFAELEPDDHARLKVIGWTRATPALPFITAARYSATVPQLYEALSEAIAHTEAVPGVPVRLMPARDADYNPIREIAHNLIGYRLAPGAVPLGNPG